MKTFIIVWLMVLSIAIVALIGHIQCNTAAIGELQKFYSKAKIRLDLIELNDPAQIKKTVAEYVIKRAEERVERLLRNRHVVPVSRALLAVEKEE